MFLNEAKELKAFSMGIVESENGFASILSEAILTEDEAVKSGDEAKKESNIKNFFNKVQNWLKEQLKKLKNLAGNVLRSIKENFGALKHRVQSGEWMKGSHARHKVAYVEGIANAAHATMEEAKKEMLAAEGLLRSTIIIVGNVGAEKQRAEYEAAVQRSKEATEKFKAAAARADEVYKKVVDAKMDKAQKKADKAAGVKSSGSTNKLIAAGESMWKTVSGLVSNCIKAVTTVFSKSKATGDVEKDKENRNLVLRAKDGLLKALSSIGRGIAAIFGFVLKPIKFLVGKVKKGEDKGQEGSNLPAVVK